MKTRILAALCAFTVSGLMGVAREEPTPAPQETPPAQVQPAKPAKEQPAVKAEAEEEEIGTIEGVEIQRADGTFLGLEISDGNFKLTFYDKKKKPAKADVARATARWTARTKPFREFTVLNPGGDGTFLVGNRFVRPPHIFTVYLTLLNEAGDAIESHQPAFSLY